MTPWLDLKKIEHKNEDDNHLNSIQTDLKVETKEIGNEKMERKMK